MAELVRYVYHCAACGSTGEVDFADDSHEGEAATCAEPCGALVTLTRNSSPPFWFEGGAGSPLWRTTTTDDPDSVHWLRVSIDADVWFKPGKVASWNEAALALCGCNPNDARAADPLAQVAPPLKDDCERLIERFHNVATADLSASRTLVDWCGIARAGGYDYHPHFDALLREYGIELPNSEAAATSPEKVKSVRRQQETIILQALEELGETPTALRRPAKNGLPGARAKVKALVVPRYFTKDAFENLWQEMRDAGLLSDEKGAST